jgi:hypothetical protein
MKWTFVLAEDRAAEEVGLRLALASLRRHVPSSPVVVYRANPTPDFVAWLRDFPSVRLVPTAPQGANSWNCKPHALIPVLEEGAPEVIWLDSDIVLAADPTALLRDRPPELMMIAREPWSLSSTGTAVRTRGWGLPDGRHFPFTLNSCFLRFTRHHLPLLSHWKALLADERYLQYQQVPFAQRPLHMLSDQDVISALIGCKDYAEVPVYPLRSGIDLIHSGGALAYSLRERLAGLGRSIPPFIHGGGCRPWELFHPSSKSYLTGWSWYARRLVKEVSPYPAIARQYRDEVGLPCPWMDYRTTVGEFMRLTGFGHFALRGLPLTLLASIARWLRLAS